MATIEKLNIRKLLNEENYLIPLYQRNYAWEREEIFQLLTDIKETTGPYYLGTLVVAQNNSKFEIIDGQQRHTALSIINSVLKYKGYDSVMHRNLYFEARETSEKTIDDLLGDKNSYKKAKLSSNGNIGIQNIINTVQDVEDFLIDNYKSQESESEFVSRFYNEIILFRAELPEKTDLNHYFEIMNNRGEQLEKHEILKAAFMSKEEVRHKEKQSLFSKIWDACSQMNCHVQMCFKTEDNSRSLLFGDQYDRIPNTEILDNYIQIKESNNSNSLPQENNEKNDLLCDSLSGIIKNHSLPKDFVQNETNKYDEKYNSIIDFPNFLLQVLKLKNDKVSLDEKLLLPTFGYPNNLPNAWEFIAELLKFRTLFDKYIIKREGDTNTWSWTMKSTLRVSEYQVTFPNNQNARRKIRMIQAMYQVTFPSNNYKNWLFDIMKLFKEYSDKLNSAEFYLSQLEKQACNYYNNNHFSDYFYNGLGTPRFIFNYLDYLLWIEYYDKVSGNKIVLNDEEYAYLNVMQKEKDKFQSFKFVQRSSIEHLFPQSRYKEIEADNDEARKVIMNSFGNLCLISRSSNSAYNNDMPSQKKHDSKSKNESLKQLIMFGSFDNENWNTVEIEKHQLEMIELLTKTTLEI